ncbi:glycosyltransferase [Paenibacillus sp. JTLBN-2024]
MPLTSIVMLTRNGLDLTRRCVESVMRHTEEPLEWIAVDNGSTDGTLLKFSNSMEDVEADRQRGKPGFAAGNSQGMLEASGDFYPAAQQ